MHRLSVSDHASSFPFSHLSRSALHKHQGTVLLPDNGEPVLVWDRRGAQGCVLEFRLWVDLGDFPRWDGNAHAGGDGQGAPPRGGKCEGGGEGSACQDGGGLGDGGGGGEGDGLAGMMVRVRFDDAATAQIDVPVHALFLWSQHSLSLTEHEMSSLVVGHARNASGWQGYLHLPMPFATGCHVSLRWAPDEAADGRESAHAFHQSRAKAADGSRSKGGWNVSYSILWTPSRACDLGEGASGKGDMDREADVGVLHVVHRHPTPVERHQDYVLMDVADGHGGGARGLLVGLVSNIEAAGMCHLEPLLSTHDLNRQSRDGEWTSNPTI